MLTLAERRRMQARRRGLHRCTPAQRALHLLCEAELAARERLRSTRRAAAEL